MVFNAHDDIWTNVTKKKELGIKNVFKEYHYKQYKEGGINGGIFVVWNDEENDENSTKRAFEIIKNMSVEIIENKNVMRIIKNSKDFVKAENENKLAAVIGVEGLNFMRNDIEILYMLYMLGVRNINLTWNEENLIATGVKGNPKRGLTSFGVNVVSLIEKLGIVLDVSHANEKTFWDICDITSKPIIASHSNCKSICDVPRNLTDEQLKAISQKNGVVGINICKSFVSENENNQTIEGLVKHLDHMVEVMGIDHVGFGFDFCDYLYDDNETSTLKGFESLDKVQNLINLLVKKGYSSEDIEKIKYKNFVKIIEEII